MRILLVEDEPEAARLLAKGLREQSYAVDLASDGKAAVFRAETTNYDAIILDIMLPALDGISVCRALRKAGSSVPILMVTARGTVQARVEGLDSGADDYLTKPFDFIELLARLRALIRRGVRPPLPDRLSAGTLVLDTRSREVTNRGRKVALTTREYALLEYFARHPNEVLGRADIAEHVWDESYDAFSNVIDVYVQRLRRKLDREGELSVIATRRGQGYIFTPGSVLIPMALTIRTRLTLWYSLVLFVTLAATAVALVIVHSRLGLNRIDRGLADTLVTVSNGLDHELDEGLDLPHAVADALSELEVPGTGVAILDSAGTLRGARASAGPDAARCAGAPGRRRRDPADLERWRRPGPRRVARARRPRRHGGGVDLAGAVRRGAGHGSSHPRARAARRSPARDDRRVGGVLAGAGAAREHGAPGERDRRPRARLAAGGPKPRRRAERAGPGLQRAARSPGDGVPGATPVHGRRLAPAPHAALDHPDRRPGHPGPGRPHASTSTDRRCRPSPSRPSA